VNGGNGNGHGTGVTGGALERERAADSSSRQPVEVVPRAWHDEVVPRDAMVDWVVVWLGPDQQFLGRLRGCTEVELRAEMARGGAPRGTLWPVYVLTAGWVAVNGALQRVQNVMHATQAIVSSARVIAPPMHGDLGLVHFASEYDEATRASLCARARAAEQARSGLILSAAMR
jgi:hypothetical protein